MGEGRGVDSQNILLDIFVISTSVLSKCPEWFAFFVFYAVLPVTLCIIDLRRRVSLLSICGLTRPRR